MADDFFSRSMKTLDLLFLISGIIFLFIGSTGFILSITFYGTGLLGDYVTSMALGSVYLFMSFMGMILILFHDKIIVKPPESS